MVTGCAVNPSRETLAAERTQKCIAEMVAVIMSEFVSTISEPAIHQSLNDLLQVSSEVSDKYL